MKIGMDHAALLGVDTRFYLARNLRSYDERYQDALDVAEPLVTRYPRNPIFQLLVGNLNVELGRATKASESFHAALALFDSMQDKACAARVHDIADSFLGPLH